MATAIVDPSTSGILMETEVFTTNIQEPVIEQEKVTEATEKDPNPFGEEEAKTGASDNDIEITREVPTSSGPV